MGLKMYPVRGSSGARRSVKGHEGSARLVLDHGLAGSPKQRREQSRCAHQPRDPLADPPFWHIVTCDDDSCE